MKNYKITLNLPKTCFPMRGNLVKLEPDILQRWNKYDLYKMIREAKKGNKKFILHDGPPYANGSIHLGHSVNKILKDIIIKSKGFMGYDSPYVPGWDCHGLPIELNVEQLIGKPSDTVSIEKFCQECRIYATEQIALQKMDFIRLGVIGDWKHPYLTMNFKTEANIIRVLSKIIANGYLYKGIKPVYWCIDCYSSLAESEVEYLNKTSTSIYVNFLVKNVMDIATIFGVNNFSKSISCLIWTTTPWTLPANRAISVHPDFYYNLIEFNGNGLIIAADLVNKVMQRIGISSWKIIGDIVKGSKLELLNVYHPFLYYCVPVVLSEHVTNNIGTGIVHIAPSHGIEDYVVGKQYNLEVKNTVGPDGYYLSGTFPALDKIHIFKANKIIIDLLYKKDAIFYIEQFDHSYPYCWRHKTPLIFRVTPQWFISMDINNLRTKSIAEIQNVKWIPLWSKRRIETMVVNRSDWCISRQRTWGVPMSLFIHKTTGKLHPRTIELMEEVAKRVEQYGIQAWWDLDPADLIGDDAIFYNKIHDTLDVWFDSGSTNLSIVNTHPDLKGNQETKIDLYLEGSDQYRGWFMSSLIIGAAIKGKAPYSQVLTHGFTVDYQGKKMSKSVGNVVSSQQIVDKLGGDILRLWVASTDYTSDMVISDEILKNAVDLYRRIRNTVRFLLANLHDFNIVNNNVSPDQMVVIDRWAVSRAHIAQSKIIEAYNSYNFHYVVQCIINFCSIEMSSFYFDIIKDRQYTTKTDSVARRSCQTALYHIMEALVRWIAPIISFTADEVWNLIPGERAPFVFTEEWYSGLFGLEPDHKLNDHDWETLLQVRREVNKVIEHARFNKLIGSSLEAHIILYAEPVLANQLRQFGEELSFAFITSSVTVSDYTNAISNALQSDVLKYLKIYLEKAEGLKCPRCWHYKPDIGKYIEDPDICYRCILNIYGSGEIRKYL